MGILSKQGRPSDRERRGPRWIGLNFLFSHILEDAGILPTTVKVKYFHCVQTMAVKTFNGEDKMTNKYNAYDLEQ